jgi:hypothetical protein
MLKNFTELHKRNVNHQIKGDISRVCRVLIGPVDNDDGIFLANR